VADLKKEVPPPEAAKSDGLFGNAAIDEWTEKKVDDIELIGEEVAAGYRPPGHSEVTAGMRYLHCSRTIHQLVTDRNRAVGLYIAVASLLWTASAALLNAKPSGKLRVPIETIQEWCLPVTFGTLTVLALFAGFLLIRTRVGLIYEVAKMNVLLNLPIGRVQRVNPLSIFFIMHALISAAGGASAAMFVMQLMTYTGPDGAPVVPLVVPILVGLAVTALLLFLYVWTIKYTTSDEKLQGDTKAPRS
jgi:hypothetical protein